MLVTLRAVWMLLVLVPVLSALLRFPQRKSSRAKEKKQRRLEERAAMAAVCAKVEAANKLRDPLEAFPVFKKYDRNGLDVSIECRRVSGLEPPTLDWAFELTKANMQSLCEPLGASPHTPWVFLPPNPTIGFSPAAVFLLSRDFDFPPRFLP
ncbi:N-alpha-acetyltransferase 40 [Geospiza fortis]|uniref:N-alpha-acetyltransferase 40 n=1 Tax=Geospiza fortis TaxID=48883 RepID=A0A8N5HYL5_GEOFO|nr:N-alpha-acetyltransferase 40 [Geospiza fortis]